MAQLITKGVHERQLNRVDFFRYLKTALNNQARSRVQRYRFTLKRTGQKPPPRHAEGEAAEHHKTIEMSLDDPDLGLQVGDMRVSDDDSERQFEELVEDWSANLTEFEKLVFRQLAKPNDLAACYATLDAALARAAKDKISVKIKHKHLALGLGLPEDLFAQTVLSIRTKITAMRNMTNAELEKQSRRNSLLAQLKTIFGLQIPASADDMLIRRLLTIAARDQYEKVANNPQVAQMLEEIGAKVPVMHGGTMACFGVLYDKRERRCGVCDYRASCATEASNFGLDKIRINRTLLGANQMRIPIFLPSTGTASSVTVFDEAEIVAYLEETFSRTVRNGDIYYTYRFADWKETTSRSKRPLLFCVGPKVKPLKLRFCNPSPELQKKLLNQENNWYLPEQVTAPQALALIDEHASQRYDE